MKIVQAIADVVDNHSDVKMRACTFIGNWRKHYRR